MINFTKWIPRHAWLLLLGPAASAQFKDSLAINKQDLVAQFLPRQSGNFLYAVYQMEPDEFIKKGNDFLSFAITMQEQEKDMQLRTLKKKDLDFFYRNLLLDYRDNYGIDSIRKSAYYAISKEEEKKESKDYKKVDSAYKAIRTKTLSPQNIRRLDSLIFEGWEIDDPLLFKNSASYRNAVREKVSYLTKTVYKQDYKPGNRYTILQRIVQEHIKDDFIKQYYQYGFTSTILSYPLDTAARERAYADFLALVTDSSYRAQVKDLYDNYKMGGMKEAPGFDYMDIHNKQVSLKSLRGKYVYIDIWATWCTPCKAEIPYLEKLQELYKDKNIQFVSLSVDRPSDKPKWESFVKNNHLKGIQVIADNAFESNFIRKFNINEIPRFILIDPDGKLVSGKAQAPSNKELQRLLDRLL